MSAKVDCMYHYVSVLLLSSSSREIELKKNRSLDNERSGDIHELYHNCLMECETMIAYIDNLIVELVGGGGGGLYQNGFIELMVATYMLFPPCCP